MYASIKKKNKKTNWREKKRMRGFAEFFCSFINNTNLDGSNLILFGVFVFYRDCLNFCFDHLWVCFYWDKFGDLGCPVSER